jgi:putative OPT family oligopeptide transporter
VPLFFVFWEITDVAWVAALMAVIMLVAGFLFSAVASYMAGLVGSSNNPISGVTIATILVSALLLAAFLGTGSAVGPAAAVLIGAVVCCAAAIGGDNMQDLKCGRIVGATPFRQQIMQVLGVVVAAFVMAPVLTLLLHAYGIGIPTEAHPRPLAAPQATLMAAVAGGVFGGGLPWGMVVAGMITAVAVIALDVTLERRGSDFRTPVLAVAVGIYLPLELSVAIFLGGILAWAAARFYRRRGREVAGGETGPALSTARQDDDRHGLLFAAGLITGEALLGILLAIPIVLAGRANPLAFWGIHHDVWPGIVLLLVVMYSLYRVSTGRGRRTT